MTSLIVSIKEDTNLMPLILSSSYIGTGETSDEEVDALLNILENAKTWLQRWRDFCDKIFPDYTHDIPNPEQVNLAKLNGGYINTDTCNAARKTRSLFIQKIHDLAQNWVLSDHNNIGK